MKLLTIFLLSLILATLHVNGVPLSATSIEWPGDTQLGSTNTLRQLLDESTKNRDPSNTDYYDEPDSNPQQEMNPRNMDYGNTKLSEASKRTAENSFTHKQTQVRQYVLWKKYHNILKMLLHSQKY